MYSLSLAMVILEVAYHSRTWATSNIVEKTLCSSHVFLPRRKPDLKQFSGMEVKFRHVHNGSMQTYEERKDH
jgi:hypothetical protein